MLTIQMKVYIVFQTFPGETEKWLMVRPTYPPVYHESESLKIKHDLEPLLVIHDSWKVGDLVDWWVDHCYWSGKILELQENESLQIELFSPPFGEGKIYKALCKDLRPLLEWSLEDGWKLPSMDGQRRQCAKLIKQKNKVDQVIADVCKTRKEKTKRASETENEQTKGATQQLKGDELLKLNIMESDDIEAAVLDLEELIVRVEWLKGMLGPDLGEGEKLNWKYEDYRASSTGM